MKEIGLTGKQAILSVCYGIEIITGTRPIVMGMKKIGAEQNDDPLNPTQFGAIIHIEIQDMNPKLTDQGLQTT